MVADKPSSPSRLFSAARRLLKWLSIILPIGVAGLFAALWLVISVTHRLASVQTMDGIFVFSAGKLVESGEHAQLLAADGPYAQLWAKQSGFSTDPDGVEPPSHWG